MSTLHQVNRRKFLAGTATLALAATMPSVGWSAPERNRTYIVASSVDGPTFTNTSNANYYSPGVDLRNGFMFATEPLFYYNLYKDEVIPWIGESFDYAPDFKSVTIKLKNGVEWSDGQPFTARDVAYTYNMLIDNGKNARNMRDAAIVSTKVASATVIDDQTVRVDFTQPDPRHMFQFGISYFAFGLQWVPEHIWKDVEDKATFTNFDLAKGLPVSTSAWKVVSTAPSEIICERRKDWWGAKTGFRPLPGPERIITVPSGSRDRVAQLSVSNMIDISADIQDAELIQELLRQNDKLTTFSGAENPLGNLDWWPVSVFFNSADERWNDVRVRKAFAYAINAKQIIDVAFAGAGEPSRGPFPAFPPLVKYIDLIEDSAKKNDVGVYDLAASEKLMLEAGYERDGDKFWAKDGKRAGGDMHGLALLNQIGPLVQQQLRRGGFDITFFSTPDSSKIMRSGNCPLVLSGHGNSSIFDPLATLEAFHSKNFIPVGKPSLYFARMRNPEYDAAVDPIVALKPGDPAIDEHVKKAMDIWYAAVPEVPISQHIHRLPMNQTYWTNWPGTSNPYMPPAPNHVATSTYITHMVKPVS